MHDLRDSQTGCFAGKNDRSMRTTRKTYDHRSPNGVQPDGYVPPKAALMKPKAPGKRPFTPKRKQPK